LTFKNLKEIQRALKYLEGKQQRDECSDRVMFIWLLYIVADLVDYLEQKENER